MEATTRLAKSESSRQRVYFPNEIWIDILGQYNEPHELAWLWCVGRQLSRFFQYQSEKVIRSKIPLLKITLFNVTCCVHGHTLGRKRPFVFKEFDQSTIPKRVVFRDDASHVCANKLVTHWTSIDRRGGMPVPCGTSVPRRHLIELKGDEFMTANDTELTGLRFPRTKRTISFEWKTAMNEFLGEAYHVYRYKQRFFGMDESKDGCSEWVRSVVDKQLDFSCIINAYKWVHLRLIADARRRRERLIYQKCHKAVPITVLGVHMSSADLLLPESAEVYWPWHLPMVREVARQLDHGAFVGRNVPEGTRRRVPEEIQHLICEMHICIEKNVCKKHLEATLQRRLNLRYS